MAIASLVLGIFSLILISPLLALIGLPLGIKAKKKLNEQNQPAGIAIGGIVTSSIGLIYSTFVVFIIMAVAVPKYTVAVSKAQASEAPRNLSQIESAQAVYHAENARYFQPQNTQEIRDSLGLSLIGKYFDYTIEVNEKGYVAKATLTEKLGAASVGEYLTVNQDGVKDIEGYGLQQLLPIWY